MPHKKFGKLDDSIKAGLSFGVTSGVITTLGLIVGLYTGTHSQTVVIGGVITIAIVDAMSDAFGMHMSQESRKGNTQSDVWKATISTLIAKFVLAISFLIPLFLLENGMAATVSVVWGALLIILLSYVVAKQEHEKPFSIISHHMGIMLAVIAAAYIAGIFISTFI